MTESAFISKVWNFANVLRGDGEGYGDYLEQIGIRRRKVIVTKRKPIKI